MGFRTRIAGAAVAAGLAISVLTGCNNANTNTPVLPTQQPTLEATVQATTTPENQDTLSWKYSELSYTDGSTSWTVNMADGIEDAVLRLTGGTVFATPADFLINGALVDAKYGRVIAWGTVHNAYTSKISVRSILSGAEDGSSWMLSDIINDVKLVYSDSEKENRDFMAVAGYMVKDRRTKDFFLEGGRRAGYSLRQIPFIEVYELNEEGIELITYNPLALVEGEITGIEVKQSNGSVDLLLSTVTYDGRRKRNEGTTTLELDRVLDTPSYEPIFGE